MARITGYRVEIERIQDLTADGIPEVVLRTWSGGAHGWFVNYVYSAGLQPRCLLAYSKRNGEDDPDYWPDFEARDLDGDGRQEVISWYDGFAYWSTCYAGSARVPIVLSYRVGRFVDATSNYRPFLGRMLIRARHHFRNDIAMAGDQRLAGQLEQGMIEYYSVALLLHDRTTARQMVLRLLPRSEHSAFLEHAPVLERVLAERMKRYDYPATYSNVQTFTDEAI